MDPVFTLDDIFPIEAPYGAQMDWFRDKPGRAPILVSNMDVAGHTRLKRWSGGPC